MNQFDRIRPYLPVALSFSSALLPVPTATLCTILGFMLSLVIAYDQDTMQSWVDVVLAAAGFIPGSSVVLAIIAWLELLVAIDIPK